MKRIFLMAAICIALTSSAQEPALHFKSVLADTHNDVLSELVLPGKNISNRLSEGQSDLVRWKEGGLDLQFFSIWTGDKARNPEGFFKDATQELDSLRSIADRNSERMVYAMNYKEVMAGLKAGKLVALAGVEGGHMIENDLGKLQQLYDRGARYLTLTWNNSNEWASSAMDETTNPQKLKQLGLSDFGKEVVRKMNRMGMIVDLSHTGERTFYDAIATSAKPVLLSHSSVWNICPVFRNVKDDQIRAVAKNGGVICINFYSGFLSKAFDIRSEYLNGPAKQHLQDSIFSLSKDSALFKKQWREYYRSQLDPLRPSISDLVDHIDYIVKLVGDKYVGIGSDYDGVESLPIGMEDVTTYPKITTEMLRRGYSSKRIKRILGENVLRVMKANFTD